MQTFKKKEEGKEWNRGGEPEFESRGNFTKLY
jgi:hypothetical protein